MLRTLLQHHNVILASGSPRRQEFLRNLDIDFEIRLKEVEEIYPDHLQGAAITDFLAVLKADAFEGKLTESDILITSDTIVWHNNKALGKPKDADDAFRVLQSLSGTTHEVISSVCLRSASRSVVFHEITKVSFAALPEDSIRYYIENYKPFDKAGAYGIQEWIGLTGITKIEGSYTNVVGLPVQRVYEELVKFIK